LISSEGRAEQIRLTGTVTDDKGNGLSGASVVLKGTSKGTTINLEGKHVI